jgi:hypothetical protein
MFFLQPKAIVFIISLHCFIHLEVLTDTIIDFEHSLAVNRCDIKFKWSRNVKMVKMIQFQRNPKDTFGFKFAFFFLG